MAVRKKIASKKTSPKKTKPIKVIRNKTPFKIQTMGEKMDLQMNSFMNEVIQRIQILKDIVLVLEMIYP